MADYNILVAFESEKVSGTVAKILTSEAMKPVYICSSASELKKRVHYYQRGIIVCGYKLKDSSVIQFAEDIPKDFGIIIIANKTQIELCGNDRVFKLAVPLKKQDLICSVSMLANMYERPAFKSVAIRSEEEKKLIYKAKELLIDRYGMTEQQAHKYMQKKSMDTGNKILEVAKIILSF